GEQHNAGFLHNHLNHSSTFRSDSHTNPDLTGALGNAVSEHAVNSDGSEQQGKTSEDGGHARDEAVLTHAIVDQISQRPSRKNCQMRVDALNHSAKRNKLGVRITCGAHFEI